MIVLASIPNTGTHFVLDFLKRHSQIDTVINHEHGYYGIFRQEITRSTFQYQPFADVNRAVYHRHILGNRTHGEIDLLCIGHKTVVPMRDPLLSLITRKHRNPLEPMYQHIDAFVYAATSPHVGRSFIFPIDNDIFTGDSEDRQNQGENLLCFLGLELEDYVKQWAIDNEPKNTLGSYEEKTAYYNQDIESATRGCLGEFLYLKSKQSEIQPFMEGLGYSKPFWMD